MAGWFDGNAMSSAGPAADGTIDPVMVLATFGYNHDFLGVLPLSGAVLTCRLQVRLGMSAVGAFTIASLGLVQQPWFEFVGIPAGPPLKGGSVVNLGTPILRAGQVLTTSFQIRVLTGVRVPRPGDLTAYVETVFGELFPKVRVADRPLVVIRAPGRSAKLEVLSPVNEQQTSREVVTGALVGDACWVRAGSQIAYVANPSGLAQIHIVDTSGYAPHRLTPSGPLSSARCGGAARSGNYTSLLLHAMIPGEIHWSVWEVDLDGSNQRRLSPLGTADYTYPVPGPLGFRCIRRTPYGILDLDPRIFMIADCDSNTLRCTYLVDNVRRYSNLSSSYTDQFSAQVSAPIFSTDPSQNTVTILEYYNDVVTLPWYPPTPIPDHRRFARINSQFQGSSPAFSGDMQTIAFVRGGQLFKKLFNPQRPGGGSEVVIAAGFQDGASVCWAEP